MVGAGNRKKEKKKNLVDPNKRLRERERFVGGGKGFWEHELTST